MGVEQDEHYAGALRRRGCAAEQGRVMEQGAGEEALQGLWEGCWGGGGRRAIGGDLLAGGACSVRALPTVERGRGAGWVCNSVRWCRRRT